MRLCETTTETARVEAEIRAAALRKLIEGYTDLFPALAGQPATPSTNGAKNGGAGDERPRGQEAVRQVLMETEGKWWTVSGMVRELEKRGWPPDSDVPMNAVRTALERVIAGDNRFKKSRGEKTNANTYSYRPFQLHTEG